MRRRSGKEKGNPTEPVREKKKTERAMRTEPPGQRTQEMQPEINSRVIVMAYVIKVQYITVVVQG